jgi:anaerobic magnesium-protoporphyrin IX monomethyl ester cyclase
MPLSLRAPLSPAGFARPPRRVVLASLPYGDILQVPNRGTRRFVPPVGLLGLQALCAELAEVHVLDGALFPSPQALRAAIEALEPELVGLSTYDGTYPFAAELVRQLDIPCIAGGPFATALPDRALRDFDLVARNEGEHTLRELLEGRPLDTIQGLSWRSPGGPAHNPDRPLIPELDALPLPDWASVPLHRYRQVQLDDGPSPVGLLLTARGCGHGCDYCCDALMYRGRVRFRSSEHVIAEIERMRTSHGVRFLEIADDIFTLRLDRKAALLRYLEDEGLRFSCNARPDRVDPAKLEALARAGCTSIFFGVEVATPRAMADLGRSCDLDAAEQAVAQARAQGLRVVCGFMLGTPREREDDIRATIALAQRLAPDKAIFNIVRPHPGSALTERALREGILEPYEADRTRYPGAPWGLPTMSLELSRERLQALEAEAYRLTR